MSADARTAPSTRYASMTTPRSNHSRTSPREQVSSVYTQCSCQPHDVDERNVALSPLNRADVGAMQARQFGKVLLRKSTNVPVAANPLPERGEDRRLIAVSPTGHEGNIAA